jgi:rubredoxin
MKAWRCQNCGHEEPQTDQLTELLFKWLGPLTSRVSCPACGITTIQRAWDETFTAGEFLVIRPKVNAKGRK